MTTRIGVMVRFRPQLELEKKKGCTSQKLQILDETEEVLINSNDYNGNKCYQFSKIIPESVNQRECFEQTQLPEMINRVVEGFHSTIFAYGQTGSGKTYTMEGISYENHGKGLKPLIESEAIQNENMGIIPRTIMQTFETIKKYSRVKNRIYKVYLSYLQIYNEQIYDLLNSESTKNLRIRWSKKDQFSVENLFVFQCQNSQEALQLFHKGIKNKFMATHKLNAQSSRSHCILTLRVDSMTAEDPDNIISSKMQLVDLAGSERASQTGVEGQNLKEAIEINRSLFTLRQVISALAEYFKDSNNKKEMPFVPYRDSKLTCLLKQSIGGNSYCLMIACLSPCDQYFDENISTLNYASQAGFITNQPIRNEDPRIKQINILKVKYEAKNSELIKELHKANEHIALLSSLTNQNMKVFGNHFVNGNTYSSSGSKTNGMESPSTIKKKQFLNNENRNDVLPSPSQLIRHNIPKNISRFLEGENTNTNQKDIEVQSQQIALKQKDNLMKMRDSILHPLNQNSPIRLSPMMFQSFIGQVSPKQMVQTLKEFGDSSQKVNDDTFVYNLDKENIIKDPIQRNAKTCLNQSIGGATQLTSQQTNQGQIFQTTSSPYHATPNTFAGTSNGFGFSTMGQDFAIKRLIDSVNMIRELLLSNTEMREIIDSMSSEKENFNAELNILQMENSDLREKLEIIESLSIEQRRDLLNDGDVKKQSQNKNKNEEMYNKKDIAQEMLQLRKDKRKLNERIKQLEIDNLNLQQKINPNFTHAEPTRSHLQAEQIQISRNRSTLKSYAINDRQQSNFQNNGSPILGGLSTPPFNCNNQTNQLWNDNFSNTTVFKDVTNYQQEGIINNNNIKNNNNDNNNINNNNNNNNNNNKISNNINNVSSNIDMSSEQKTRFVRKEIPSKQSKKNLRENSSKVSLATNNSYIVIQAQQQIQKQTQLQSNFEQNQTPTYYQQQQYLQSKSYLGNSHHYHHNNQTQMYPPPSASSISQHNQQSQPIQAIRQASQPNQSINNDPSFSSQNPLCMTENDCPQILQNIYSFKNHRPLEPQPINLNNSHLYSYNQVQTTTSVTSSQNVPRTAFAIKEAKQDEIQHTHHLNKSIQSSANSGACSNSSSSSGYYNNNGRIISCNRDNNNILDTQLNQRSPNRTQKNSETLCNWRAKINPKYVKQRSTTNSKRPPRTLEEGRQCKTPIHQRQQLNSLNNISQINPIQLNLYHN